MDKPIRIQRDSYTVIIFTGADGLNPNNDNADVEIVLRDGTRWSATFFTIENVKSILNRAVKTGEFRNGLYFWASDMIIVESLTEETIIATIEDLLEKEELDRVFSLLLVDE